MSCAPPGGDGMTNCGSSSESCCTSLEVAGGTYYRTYDTLGEAPPDGGWTDEADQATVSGLRLDKYLVTVGRFRQFVAAWAGGTGYLPPAASGKHAHLNAGQGLMNSGATGGYEPGWVTSDDMYVAPTDANLDCDANYATWTSSPAGAGATCRSTASPGRRPTRSASGTGDSCRVRAEWEYVAAGGSQQLEYPWGSASAGTGNLYAIYGCDFPIARQAARRGHRAGGDGVPWSGAVGPVRHGR